jgi:mono/diheme cytochrome c family protein
VISALVLAAGAAGSAQAQAAGQWRDAATLFKSTCAYCHDQSLVKGIGPELLGRGLPAAAVAYFVRHGSGAMPAFPEAQLSTAELTQLGNWIAKSPVDSQGRKP